MNVVFAPVVRQKMFDDKTAPSRVYALPEGSTKATIPTVEQGPANTSFSGGVYYARKKPTCGGNSFGLPCVFGTKHPDSAFAAEWNMCSYQGSARPWCYTRSDRSAYGYCDCETDEAEWTRPVGWLPNFHNAGPKAGGDIAILSDDLHHPITGLLYEARPQATRLKVNGSLCVRSEAYEPFVASEYFRSDTSSTHASIICSDGYALTGLAVAGTTTSLSKSAPRCGEPAGFTVQTSQKFDAPAISSTTATTVATASDCSYRAMECPEGSVAVGFKFDEAYASGHTGYCGANYYSLKLICAPYTPTDSANYRRVCANAACSGALGTPQQVSLPF